MRLITDTSIVTTGVGQSLCQYKIMDVNSFKSSHYLYQLRKEFYSFIDSFTVQFLCIYNHAVYTIIKVINDGSLKGFKPLHGEALGYKTDNETFLLLQGKKLQPILSFLPSEKYPQHLKPILPNLEGKGNQVEAINYICISA